MTRHTISGYLSNLEMRSAKTIIVEGKDDKKFISRIAHQVLGQHQPSGLANLIIDTADLLKTETGIIGNRALVEETHRRAAHEKLQLLAVVDREYREFQFEKSIMDCLSSHNAIDGTLWWTRGHSIENYLLVPQVFILFLRQQFADSLAIGNLQQVIAFFPSILNEVCALTLSLNSIKALRKAEGVASASAWSFSDNNTATLDLRDIINKLIDRRVEVDDALSLTASMHHYRTLLSDCISDDIGRWLSHGHLAWELCWLAVASLVSDLCDSRATVGEIGHGYASQKFISACDTYSGFVCNELDLPFPGLWQHFEECNDSPTSNC